MPEQFRYETKTYIIADAGSASRMALDIQARFNHGWKPTTNGPCVALAMTAMPKSTNGWGTWLLMYVFAREKATK